MYRVMLRYTLLAFWCMTSFPSAMPMHYQPSYNSAGIDHVQPFRSLADFIPHGTTKPWMSYVLIHLYHLLEVCELGNIHSRKMCSNQVSNLDRLYKQSRVLRLDRSKDVLPQTFRIVMMRDRVMRLPLSVVQHSYLGKFPVRWSIMVHKMFSINITVTQFHMDLLPAYQTGGKLYCSRRLGGAVLRMKQAKPVLFHPYTLILCGHPTAKTVGFQGYKVTISVIKLSPLTNVAFKMTHEVTEKLQEATMADSVLGDALDPYGIRYKTYGPVVDVSKLRVPTPDSYLWVITTRLMHRLQINMTEASVNTLHIITFIDGPVGVHDLEPEFPTVYLQHDIHAPALTINSTLNDAAIFMHLVPKDIHTQEVMVISFMSFASCLLCPINTLNPGHVVNGQITTRQTTAYNLTYTLNTDIYPAYSLVLNISHLEIIGHYTPGCRYGGIFIDYKENLRIPHHERLGMYCSVASIRGILKIARPLYLSGGSLSILIKSYQNTHFISMTFTVSLSLCRGIIDVYLMKRLKFYASRQIRNDTNEHYTVQGTYYKNMATINDYFIRDMNLFRSSSQNAIMYNKYPFYKLIRHQGKCLYYQVMPSDAMPSAHNTNQEDVMNHIEVFSQHTGSTEQIITRTTSNYQVRILNPNDFRRILFCRYPQVDRNYAGRYERRFLNYYKMQIVSNGLERNMPIDDQNATVYLDQVTQVTFPGTLMKCRWYGYSLFMEITDSLANIPDRRLQPFQAYRFIASLAAVDLVFNGHNITNSRYSPYSQKQQRTIDMYMAKNNFNAHDSLYHVTHWTFQLDTSHPNVFVNFHILSDNCAYSNAWLMQLYNVYHELKSLAYINTRYIVVDNYPGLVNGDVWTISHIFGPGFHIVHSPDKGLFPTCKVHVRFECRSMHYASNIQYNIINAGSERHFNQWKMCWRRRCYLLNDDAPIPRDSSWEEAEQFCQSHNGHLLGINSDGEYAAVLKWLVSKRVWVRDLKYGHSSLHLRSSFMFLGMRHFQQVCTFVPICSLI